MSIIEFNNVSKSYVTSNSENIIVLKDFNFYLNHSDFISILGPSGSGKTTILKIICGLETKTSGKVFINDSLSISYVFQDSLLLPWMNIFENIKLPLEIKQKEYCKERIYNLLNDVGLSSYSNYYPHELSGGMKRRVALARGIITNPDILLLDEPFTGIDFRTKESLLKLIEKIYIDNNISIIMSTHNIDEAINLSSRIDILSDKPSYVKSSISLKNDQSRKNMSFWEIEEQIKEAFFKK